jgi:hypothetical protein
MVRSIRTVGLSLVLLLGITSASSAQLFIGGGPTFPNGDYGEYAKTGWLATVGIGFDLGTKGLWLAPEFLYGSNSHSDIDGDKTNLYGGDAVLGYTFRRDKSVRPYIFGLGGYLVHQYSPADGEGDSEGAFAYGFGGGLAFKLGGISLWSEARYMSRDGTNFVPILFGLQFGGN